MTTQLELSNSKALARTTDPDTSHAAAKAVSGQVVNRVEALVLEAIRMRPCGATAHEIVADTGIAWSTATPRLKPLRAKGLIVDSGQRRPGPGSNRLCIVWTLAH